MIDTVLMICFVLVFVSVLLGLYRLFLGPTVLDRVLAYDTLTIGIIGLLILFSIRGNTVYYLEIIIIFCLIGFTSTIAFMDYLVVRKKREIEGHDDE